MKNKIHLHYFSTMIYYYYYYTLTNLTFFGIDLNCELRREETISPVLHFHTQTKIKTEKEIKRERERKTTVKRFYKK